MRLDMILEKSPALLNRGLLLVNIKKIHTRILFKTHTYTIAHKSGRCIKAKSWKISKYFYRLNLRVTPRSE